MLSLFLFVYLGIIKNKTVMAQSSIEWLMEIGRSRTITKEEFQQAKAMHKEEIQNAFSSGEHQQGFEGEAEQYYNETFNTK